MVFPICAGEAVTLIPAACIALIFSGALPFPFETIAPACPILLSAGAVKPAINPTKGLFLGLLFLIHSQAYYILLYIFLCFTSDFADHHYSLSLRVVHKPIYYLMIPFENVDEVCSVERISADSYDSGLTQTSLGGLVHGLVSQSS